MISIVGCPGSYPRITAGFAYFSTSKNAAEKVRLISTWLFSQTLTVELDMLISIKGLPDLSTRLNLSQFGLWRYRFDPAVGATKLRRPREELQFGDQPW